jgi:hypothetical protein
MKEMVMKPTMISLISIKLCRRTKLALNVPVPQHRIHRRTLAVERVVVGINGNAAVQKLVEELS